MIQVLPVPAEVMQSEDAYEGIDQVPVSIRETMHFSDQKPTTDEK